MQGFCSKAMVGLTGGAVLVLALPVAGAAQEVRDLDQEASQVRILTGEIIDGPVRFSYTIDPGEAVVIDVLPTSESALDPMLTVTDAVSGEVLVEDDDGGEGTAARGRLYSAEGRRITIEVAPFAFAEGETSSGAFELRLSASAFTPRTPQAVEFGGQASGVLQPMETHSYTLTGEAGTLLQVAMLSQDDELDPILALYPGEGENGEALRSDDDGAGERNALLRFVLPQTGTYTIAAAGFDGSGGAYTLSVAPARVAEPQAPVQAIGLRDPLGGRLGEGYENGGFDPAAITYQLTPEAIAAIRAGRGEITFNMTAPGQTEEDVFASPIDAFLELGFETPLGFATVMSDDDGGTGLDARLAVDLSPLRGSDWLERLRVRAAAIGQGGDYRIEMVEGMQAVVEEAYEEDAMEGPDYSLEPGADQSGDDPYRDMSTDADESRQDEELVPTEVTPAPPIRANPRD